MRRVRIFSFYNPIINHFVFQKCIIAKQLYSYTNFIIIINKIITIDAEGTQYIGT